MPEWFTDTLLQILAAAKDGLILLTIVAIISFTGFFARTGYGYVSKGRGVGGLLRWAYSGIVGTTIVLLGLAASFDWKIWASIAFIVVLGFFGVFFVPGSDG